MQKLLLTGVGPLAVLKAALRLVQKLLLKGLALLSCQQLRLLLECSAPKGRNAGVPQTSQGPKVLLYSV